MKKPDAWQLSMQILPIHRHRHHTKRPVWIVVLVCLVSLFVICGYIVPPLSRTACYLFSSRGCKAFTDWIPPLTRREFTDGEVASQVVINEIMNMEPRHSKIPKIAFMFLTPGTLPFEKLWDLFFHLHANLEPIYMRSTDNKYYLKIHLMGHDGKFTVYVHASQQKPVHQSHYFINSDIRSDKVVWGDISMIDAERRLLANALRDPDNQHFVLLSDSCVPLHDFDYVYHYLLNSNLSFIDSFTDPGPHGNARYSERMLPEIEEKYFQKGAQWFTMKRQHAVITMADNLYYYKFREYCRPGLDGRNCYSDEHYLPTFLNMIDPGSIANWSVTHVDWSEHKWHPKAYRTKDVTSELLHNIKSIDMNVHVTSEEQSEVQERPCLWNGVKRPCYLFARKFYPETLHTLMQLFSNYTNF